MALDITDSMIETYPDEYKLELRWAREHRVRLNFYDYEDFSKANKFLEGRRFKTFLEMGVLFGGSLMLFSRYVEAGGRIIGLDNMSAFADDQKTLEIMIRKRIVPLFDWVSSTRQVQATFIRESAYDWLMKSNETFDLIHVDASHDIDSFFRDVLIGYKKLSKDGLLLIDDCEIKTNGLVRGSAVGWRLIRDRVGFDLKGVNDRYGCILKTSENDDLLLPLCDLLKDWPRGK